MRCPIAPLRTRGAQLLIGGLLLLVTAPGIAERAGAADAERGAADEDVQLLIQRMEPLWEGRDQPGALYDLVTLGMLALAMDPDNYEALWRTARAHFWVAYTQSNRVIKKAVAAKAMSMTERTIAVRPNRVEGHYLYAMTVGEYALTIGILRAIREGIVGKIEGAAARAYEINRDFDGGGPMVVLGRLYFMLPWPKRDLERSQRYLEELRVRHPGALTGRLYLAETYRDVGDEARSRAELRYILNTAKPGDEVAARARDALETWFD